jgi:hypothetical protein
MACCNALEIANPTEPRFDEAGLALLRRARSGSPDIVFQDLGLDVDVTPHAGQ